MNVADAESEGVSKEELGRRPDSKEAAALKSQRKKTVWREKHSDRLKPGEITLLAPQAQVDTNTFADDCTDIDDRSYPANAFEDLRESPASVNMTAQ